MTRSRDRHAAIHGLLAAGRSKRDTVRILDLARGTVHRFAAAATAGELAGQGHHPAGQARPVQALPEAAVERRDHQRRGPARRAASQRLARQRAGRGTLGAAIPRDDRRAAGSALAWPGLPSRCGWTGTLMHAIANGALADTWPCPINADRAARMTGARAAAAPLPPAPLPAGSIAARRRVHASGRIMINNQPIKLGPPPRRQARHRHHRGHLLPDPAR